MSLVDDPMRATWIDALPALMTRCAARWGLEIGQPLEGGYLSRVFSCVDTDGNQLVLKLAPPAMPATLEATALRLWNGRGAVSLKDWDAEAGALLLDRIVPGTPFPPEDDRKAIGLAGEVLRMLHGVPVPDRHPFPTLPEAFDLWEERVRADAEAGTVGVGLLPQARAAALRLCETAGDTVLLHGDFLDKNLLLGTSGLVAIDPMPRIGEPCADIGFFAANHPPARSIGIRARVLARRLDHDPSRSERWAAVWAVGEACETWRRDSDEVQEWVGSAEAARLLAL